MISNPPDGSGEPPAPEEAPTAGGRELSHSDAELERLTRSLPPEDRRQLLEVVRTSLSVQHSGPLPTPEFLRQYEDIMPGLAERIVRMPENEQKHRHDFADEWLRREARLRDRGQFFGMAALVILLGFCVLLAVTGNPKIAGAVAIATVAAVVGVFVTGRYADAKAIETDGDDRPDG